MSKVTRTPAAQAFTVLILETFRLNGRLLAAGDDLCRDLGLSSARWQVLGAIDNGPLPVAHIARTMGLTRQGVQRLANDLEAEGWVGFKANPHHRRAKLVALTDRGRQALDEINRRQAAWADGIAAGLTPAELDAAAGVLLRLRQRLDVAQDDA